MQRTALDGLKVIITRPADQGAGMADLVARAGGIPVVLPMIGILPAEDFGACDEALRHPGRYQGVVFASANAVHAFFGRAKVCGADLARWNGIRTFAVGLKTAHVLGLYGVTAAAAPSPCTGEALGSLLGAKDIRGKRFLLPRGDRGREEIAEALKAAGALVVPVVVYRTAGPDAETATAMRSAMFGAARKAVLFASPSAVEEFVRLFAAEELLQVLPRAIVVVIGTTTAAAAASHGVQVHAVAATSTDAGLIGALVSSLPVPMGR